MSDVPPACISMRWSAVVAGWPHQWQAGLDASRALRLFRYFGVSYSRVMSGVPLWRCRPLLARAPQGACCHASCSLGLVVPPRAFGLSPWWPDVCQLWTVTIRVCVVHTPHPCLLGMGLYPRFRVSSNPLRMGLGLCVCLVVCVCHHKAADDFGYLWHDSVA